MLVDLAYGVDGLTVVVPDDATVILPTELPGLADQEGAISDALARPLAGPSLHDLVRSHGLHGAPRVAVVFPDLTRPMPNRTVLPPLLVQLAQCGIPDTDITLLCATGTHRQATPAEMEELVGPDIVARYTIVDHRAQSDAHVAVAQSDAHVAVGEVDGTPILLQREYVEADLRIITGFVEPHFFAGFSGGPKAVCPGLAAPRRFSKRITRVASPMQGPPSSPGRGTRCTISCGPPSPSPPRTSRWMWRSMHSARSPRCSPARST